jgi:hypothetical protein
VDGIGVGAGVCDFLKAFHIPYFEVNFAGKADDPRYYNKRSECYGRFKTLMVEEGVEFPPVEQQRNELMEQLSFVPLDMGCERIKILPKEVIRAKLGYSPDVADAAVITKANLKNNLKTSVTRGVGGVLRTNKVSSYSNLKGYSTNDEVCKLW